MHEVHLLLPMLCCGVTHAVSSLLSVSEDLLCAFELLKPLDGPALRKEMTKAKRKRFGLLFASCSCEVPDAFAMDSMMNAA